MLQPQLCNCSNHSICWKQHIFVVPYRDYKYACPRQTNISEDIQQLFDKVQKYTKNDKSS